MTVLRPSEPLARSVCDWLCREVGDGSSIVFNVRGLAECSGVRLFKRWKVRTAAAQVFDLSA